MTAFQALIKRHPLFTYYLLTFVISWGAILMVIGLGGILGTENVPESRMAFVYVATLLGPSIAGFVLTGLVSGRTGFLGLLSGVRMWRVGAGWYLVALLTAPLVIAAILFALSPISLAFLPTILATDDRSSLVVSGLVAGLMVGIFEELGWTGFAIPRLRMRHSVLNTGLIVGFLWGLWHFPLFLGSSGSFGGVPPALDLAVRLFTFLPAFRVLMVWVYDRTKSLLLTMLMHWSLTASTLILQPRATGVQVLVYDLVFAAALWLCVAVVVAVNRGSLEVRK